MSPRRPRPRHLPPNPSPGTGSIPAPGHGKHLPPAPGLINLLPPPSPSTRHFLPTTARGPGQAPMGPGPTPAPTPGPAPAPVPMPMPAAPHRATASPSVMAGPQLVALSRWESHSHAMRVQPEHRAAFSWQLPGCEQEIPGNSRGSACQGTQQGRVPVLRARVQCPPPLLRHMGTCTRSTGLPRERWEGKVPPAWKRAAPHLPSAAVGCGHSQLSTA